MKEKDKEIIEIMKKSLEQYLNKNLNKKYFDYYNWGLTIREHIVKFLKRFNYSNIDIYVIDHGLKATIFFNEKPRGEIKIRRARGEYSFDTVHKNLSYCWKFKEIKVVFYEEKEEA